MIHYENLGIIIIINYTNKHLLHTILVFLVPSIDLTTMNITYLIKVSL